MIVLKVLLGILLGLLLLIFLLGFLRIGGDGEYSKDGVKARVKVGPVHIQVFPAKKPKKEKKKKEKPTKKKKKPKKGSSGGGKPSQEGEAEETPKEGGKLDLVKAALPLIGEAAGALKRRIRIDELRMDVLFGGHDAAQTAIAYGMSNALIGDILAIFKENFDVKEYRVRTAVDFTAGSTTIWLRAAFSARIWQLVGFVIRYGWKYYRSYKAVKAADNTKKEATLHGREEAHPQ